MGPPIIGEEPRCWSEHILAEPRPGPNILGQIFSSGLIVRGHICGTKFGNFHLVSSPSIIGGPVKIRKASRSLTEIIRKQSILCFSCRGIAPNACSQAYKPFWIIIQFPDIMMTIHWHLSLLFLLAINAVKWVTATPLSETATIRTRFTSKKNPNVSIRFVTNSGVCETTPGVRQISGYLDVGKNMSMVSITSTSIAFYQVNISLVSH
jgi:hypothetical protein